MCSEENVTTLYDPNPKKDLELPPMIQSAAEDSVGSLPTAEEETVELREALENLCRSL